MDKDFGICGREKEIESIHKFVNDHINANTSGILYLTGPPGTGKTLSINLILERVRDVAKLRLNCFKVQKAKSVLLKICDSLDITLPAKSCESSLIKLLEKKITGRTCKPFLLVLDEMDQLPKSSNTDFFRTIFSWTKQSFSKLMIIGIANTVNLTARSQAFASIDPSYDKTVEKIIFKPYTSKDIQAILRWYLENDENLNEAVVDDKVVELISKKVAREKGDIRTAVDQLRDTIYDYSAEKRKKEEQEQSITTEILPTPPSTPPLTPKKERVNLASAMSSVKKRHRESHYYDDKAPPTSEIVLICLMKLCSMSKDSSVDSKVLYGKAIDILTKYGSQSNHMDVRSVLEQLELQGTVSFRKRPRMMSDKIMLKASENEISRLSKNKESILEFVARYF